MCAVCDPLRKIQKQVLIYAIQSLQLLKLRNEKKTLQNVFITHLAVDCWICLLENAFHGEHIYSGFWLFYFVFQVVNAFQTFHLIFPPLFVFFFVFNFCWAPCSLSIVCQISIYSSLAHMKYVHATSWCTHTYMDTLLMKNS